MQLPGELVACRPQVGEQLVAQLQPRLVVQRAQAEDVHHWSASGAIAGYALADGRDRWLGAVLGGALGSAGGRAAEKAKKTRPGWELIIKLDNGKEIGIQVPMARKKKDRTSFSPGERVRLMSGPGGQTSVTRA